MTHRTIISFPTVIAYLSGCQAVEVGATYVWVHICDGRRIKIKRSLIADLIASAESDNGNALAFKARQLACPGE